MQFLTDTNIDFMRLRKPLGIFSTLLVVVALAYVFFIGHLNIGIDFAGGTQIALRFQEQPELDQLRDLLNQAGIESPQIQRYGVESKNEVLIRTATVAGSEEGSSAALLGALDAQFNAGQAAGFDLNREGPESLAALLLRLDPSGLNPIEGADNPYVTVADEIIDLRRDRGLITEWSEVQSLPGVSPEVASAVEQNSRLGSYAILSVENVGPQIGNELREKGVLAVLFSLIGMLIYIALRFELRFGVGAVVAIIHDVAITLGLYALIHYEFNLTTIAAFLTLIGYSVNDTVVVFDRVRENMDKVRKEPLRSVLNQSLNQTLTRTVMTSGTTLVAVATLYVLGGEVLKGFSFILMVGVIVGTYSSVFVASPVVLLWERWVHHRRAGSAG